MGGGKGEGMALLRVWTSILLSLSYSYYISSKLRKGVVRLASLLPILILHTLLPLSLSSTIPAGVTAFFVTWLANFKLLLFSFHLGPLSSAPSLPSFLLTAAFPVKISPNPKSCPRVLPLPHWSKILLFAALAALCDRYDGALPQWALFTLYCAMLYFFIDSVLGFSNLLVGSLMGVQLEAPSDEPYVASSLQDFWGRRWNLMVADTLRHTIYFPLKALLSNSLGKVCATCVAVTVSFLVSGLVHELIFFYLTRVSPTWEVTWFFLLQGMCVVLEVAFKNSLGPKLRLHWALTGPLAAGFVIGTGFLWFFPPLVRNQVDLKAIQELISVYDFVTAIFK